MIWISIFTSSMMATIVFYIKLHWINASKWRIQIISEEFHENSILQLVLMLNSSLEKLNVNYKLKTEFCRHQRLKLPACRQRKILSGPGLLVRPSVRKVGNDCSLMTARGWFVTLDGQYRGICSECNTIVYTSRIDLFFFCGNAPFDSHPYFPQQLAIYSRARVPKLFFIHDVVLIHFSILRW